MAKKLKSYSDKFRADAVVLLESSGYPDVKGALEKVSKHLGIHYTTLHGWYNKKNNPAPDDLVRESRVELTEAISKELDSIFKQMGNVRDEATYRDLAVAAGIFIDKKRLLSGESTESNDTTIRFEWTETSAEDN